MHQGCTFACLNATYMLVPFVACPILKLIIIIIGFPCYYLNILLLPFLHLCIFNLFWAHSLHLIVLVSGIFQIQTLWNARIITPWPAVSLRLAGYGIFGKEQLLEYAIIMSKHNEWTFSFLHSYTLPSTKLCFCYLHGAPRYSSTHSISIRVLISTVRGVKLASSRFFAFFSCIWTQQWAQHF